MALNPNDELNILSQKSEFKRRAIPFKEYFAPMEITREQKKRRIRLAEIIAGIYYTAFSLIDTQSDFNIVNFTIVALYIREELIKAYEDETKRINDAFLLDHAMQQAAEIIAVNKRHVDDPYYTSDDRAEVIAENDANCIISYDELQMAIDAGYTEKTWHGMLDKRERESHVRMEGTTIPIQSPFDVNGSLMMVPGSGDMGAAAEEIVNCRCWLTYS